MDLSTRSLVCPHCGHDGTRETGRTPGGSYGFNYLAEGLISREVSGYDQAGSLRLSAEYRWQPMQGENTRLECRACWHTFPLPEGLPGPVAAGAAPPPSRPPTHRAPAGAEPGVLEQIEQLRETVIRQAADARERTDALEAAYREATKASTWLGEVIAQLEVGQQATKQRLDAQADVIRGLHAAAQEQKTRGEEMRTAVQRLEEIVAALGRVGPLPKDL